MAIYAYGGSRLLKIRIITTIDRWMRSKTPWLIAILH